MNNVTPLTSLLVHADASMHLQARLRLALALARRHSATLDVLYAVQSGVTRMPNALGTAVGAGYGVFDLNGPLMQTLLKAEADRCVRSRAVFERLQMDEPGDAGDEARVHWHEATGEPLPALVQAAWSADCLVLGQHDPEDTACGVLPGFVSDVLLATGKPGLVVPYIGAGEAPGRHVLVAWKPTPEAARAVTAALPLLRGAERVQLAAWAETDTPAHSSPAPATAGIDTLLRRHGVQAEVLNLGRASGDLGEHLLSLAADTNADLLVMGCYSKSRARERLLGGVTHTVLQSMTVPVLMAH